VLKVTAEISLFMAYAYKRKVIAVENNADILENESVPWDMQIRPKQF